MEAVFAKPDWEGIRESGRMAMDMHFHTSCSDSFTDIKSALSLAEERGIGLAVTDHNLISSLTKIKGTEPPVPVIPGMEVSTTDGPHILVYFYDLRDLERFWHRAIRPQLGECPWLALRDLPTAALLDLLEDENCVVSAAHPMGYLGTLKGAEVCVRRHVLDEATVLRMDAYEVICSGMTRDSNLKALEAASRHGLGFTGGSDGHTLGELGRVVTVSDANDVDSFLDSIKDHRNDVVGLEKTVPRKVQMASASLAKFMMHSPSALRVQARQTARSADRTAKRTVASIRAETERIRDGIGSQVRRR